MIWEPFVLALFLGLLVSAGLYFAYLWPQVEPLEEPADVGIDSRVATTTEAPVANVAASDAGAGDAADDGAEDDADAPAPAAAADDDASSDDDRASPA